MNPRVSYSPNELRSETGSRAGGPHAEGPPQSMLERMTLILDLFDDRSARMRLDEVVAHTGLPRSSCYRILEQLTVLGWLRQRPRGYGLGPRALRLGGGHDTNEDLRVAALPALEELHASTGATAYLGVLDFDEVVILDRVTRLPSASAVRVGHRAPAQAPALGKALLAGIDPEEAETNLAGRLRPCTPATITNLTVLYAELHRIRARDGLAFDSGEHLPGIYGVATVIRGADGIRGALGVSTPGTATTVKRFAPLVVEAARRVSSRMDPDDTEASSSTPADTLVAQVLALLDDDALL
ncbi:IclR family transcriptional regulator [Nocardia sp. NPDC004604]|uniref:IclR family transcriptional regulator n=1 Tax=Nocardia sp. NPDC004604 TaxID=3157013 RepID=UPI00339F5B4B